MSTWSNWLGLVIDRLVVLPAARPCSHAVLAAAAFPPTHITLRPLVCQLSQPWLSLAPVQRRYLAFGRMRMPS